MAPVTENAAQALLLSILLWVRQGFAGDPGALPFSGETRWDKAAGTLTITTSGTMPEEKEAFFWEVPPEVKRIVIGAGVTFRGGFRVGFRKEPDALWIEGADRKTSIIFGTDEPRWTAAHHIADSEKWKYGSISVLADATVIVTNLTSQNPRGYHVSGYANRSIIHLKQCDVIDNRPGDNNNSDGFVGAAGSSIRDCFFSTSDDAIKVYHDITIQNVTIEQRRNGAALQLGWGGEEGTATAQIRNLRIIGKSADNRYNMAPITWEASEGGVRHLFIESLTVQLEGLMYLESERRWVPVGLFEAKPSQATLNVQVNGADISAASYGIVNCRGDIEICGTTVRTNRYRCDPR